MILYDWLGVVAIITFVVCSGLLYETQARRRPHPNVTPVIKDEAAGGSGHS